MILLHQSTNFLITPRDYTCVLCSQKHYFRRGGGRRCAGPGSAFGNILVFYFTLTGVNFFGITMFTIPVLDLIIMSASFIFFCGSSDFHYLYYWVLSYLFHFYQFSIHVSVGIQRLSFIFVCTYSCRVVLYIQ